jgi:trehalose 6-phosphate phosphatase
MSVLADAEAPNSVPFADLPKSAAGLAFFFDLDGTLIDIAETPDDVVVPSDLTVMLSRLAALADGAVAIVSGRAIATIDRLLAPLHLPAAGAHGAEMRGPNGEAVVVTTEGIEAVRQRLLGFARRHPAIRVEDKGVAFAVHYRADPTLRPLVEEAVRRAVAPHPDLHIQRGKMVYEVHAAGIDKGRALAALMREPPFAGRVPVAVGDDLTDEGMFVEAARLGGVTVAVGTDLADTAASLVLPDPAAVRNWIRKLVGDR